ncbi:hypothetical protein QJS04_geneDACA018321 [Acorus gramineus]|uniref:SHSP domain-containing protein n=1 Tax=Acorus gramineus TaxID=55184 RepID=A0AAV9B725_ACOGR|nr:hypothetical protein QJS04_geneDACA018321 [Acorus gramineus]
MFFFKKKNKTKKKKTNRERNLSRCLSLSHVFKADLPGLKKEEVKVEVEEGRVLQISGERSREKEEKNDTWHRVERSSGRFLRRFRLPEGARVDQVKAAMENGVLMVTVPERETARERERDSEREISICFFFFFFFLKKNVDRAIARPAIARPTLGAHDGVHRAHGRTPSRPYIYIYF